VAGIARFTSGLPVTLLNNNDTSLLGTIWLERKERV
jgi:hypothetical protein